VSGYTSDSSAKEMLKKGAFSFLYKPYDYAEIVRVLDNFNKK
jgi:ActR/RegA family two-component response regulator